MPVSRSSKVHNRQQPEMDSYDSEGHQQRRRFERNGTNHNRRSESVRHEDDDDQPLEFSKRERREPQDHQLAHNQHQQRSFKSSSDSKHESQQQEPLSQSYLNGRDSGNKSQPVSGKLANGDVLTIRNILDHQEIQNQIAVMRRSTGSNNSNPVRTPYAPSPTTASSRQNHDDRGRSQMELGSRGRSVADVRKHSSGSHRNEIGNSSTKDMSLDQSLLEKRFREKLDAMTDGNSKLLHSSVTREQELQRDRTDTYPYPPRSPATQRRQRDLYHSSYSPSDFSQSGDDDLSKDDDNDDDGERTVELKPGQGGIVSSTPVQTHNLVQSTFSSASKASTRPNRQAASSNFNVKKATEPVVATGDDPGYDIAEISFEREVAIARAKRELGASINGPGTSAVVPASSSQPRPQIRPHRPASSKLDHGRDLVLEDLVSPTSYKFGGRNPAHNLITRPNNSTSIGGLPWPSAAPLPLPQRTAASGLTRVDTVTETQTHFMEMAGTLGEGQAVGTVFGTYMGMVRDLKMENKKARVKIKELEKDLKKTQRGLEKANKSKERLAAAAALASTKSRGNTGHKHGLSNSIQGDSEQERISAGIRHERDQVERNLVVLQNRMAVQEQQMADIRKGEKMRKQQEAELMMLMEPQFEEEAEEEETQDSEDDEDYDVDEHEAQIQLQSARYQIVGDGQSDEKKTTRLNQRRKGYNDDNAGDTKLSHAGKIRQPKPRRTALLKQKENGRQMQFESRRGSDRMEEVHIHHHVHYSDDDDEEEYLNIRHRQTGMYSTMRPSGSRHNHPEDSRAAHFAPRQSHRVSPGTIQIPVRSILNRSVPGKNTRAHHHLQHNEYDGDDNGYDGPGQNFRSPSQSKFRRSHGHSVNNAKGIAFDKNLCTTYGFDNEEEEEALQDWRRQKDLDNVFRTSRMISAHKADAATSTQADNTTSTSAASQHQPEQHQQQQQQPSASTQLSDSQTTETLAIPVTIPLKSKASKKKTYYDIPRILSMLRPHDRSRCTVCLSGDSHYHDGHHPTLRIDGRPVTISRRTSTTAGTTSTATTPTTTAAASASSDVVPSSHIRTSGDDPDLPESLTVTRQQLHKIKTRETATTVRDLGQDADDDDVDDNEKEGVRQEESSLSSLETDFLDETREDAHRHVSKLERAQGVSRQPQNGGHPAQEAGVDDNKEKDERQGKEGGSNDYHHRQHRNNDDLARLLTKTTTTTTVMPNDMKGKGKLAQDKQKRQQQVQQHPSFGDERGQDDLNNDRELGCPPEKRLHEALQLLEDEVRELRESYVDLTQDLEVLVLETELMCKRQAQMQAQQQQQQQQTQTTENKHHGSGGGVHHTSGGSGADLESLNRKKKLIQEQLRRVLDTLEEKADQVMALQEQRV
ncbi:hypothetical protein BG004_006484 [Podila humilis]|nr:hypothetical protein BG004_006484 [Podila humilis]